MAQKKPRKAPAKASEDDNEEEAAATTAAEKPKAATTKKPKTVADLAAGDDYFGTDEDGDEGEDIPVNTTTGKTVAKVAATGKPLFEFYDSRKLSKANKANLAGWKTAQRGKLQDKFFRRQAEEARKKYGNSSVFIGSSTNTLVVGIPCPALAFEYVIAQDCFPLGLVMQIVAVHGIGKSAMLAEFGRWFNLAGGGMILAENETKFNPHWYSSILGHEFYDRMQLYRCSSVEDWQTKLTHAVQTMKRDMKGTKEAPGPGPIFPVLYGVDSIMGKMSEENQEKILGEMGAKGERGTTGTGYAAPRSYPIEAGSITKYMRTIPQELDSWPFSLVLINHLRNKKDDSGNAERSKTGGEQVNFQESFELELKKLGGHKKKIETKQFEGVPLLLTCEKNSFGPTHRQAQLRLIWWHEDNPETGHPDQVTRWDWDWSTTQLLLSQTAGEKANVYIKNRLADIGFHIKSESGGDTDNSAWSKTLGMSKDDAVSYTELGAMIREDVALMDKLRDALCITRRPFLAGDYMRQLNAMAGELP